MPEVSPTFKCRRPHRERNGGDTPPLRFPLFHGSRRNTSATPGETGETRPSLPTGLVALVDRLDAAGLLADGDRALIAEMYALDPEGTAWLLRDMLLRGGRS